MDMQTFVFFDIEDLQTTVVVFDDADVAQLAAGFGVKRRDGPGSLRLHRLRLLRLSACRL